MLKANTEDFQVFANFKSVPQKSSELDIGSNKVEYLLYNPHRTPIVPLEIRLQVTEHFPPDSYGKEPTCLGTRQTTTQPQVRGFLLHHGKKTRPRAKRAGPTFGNYFSRFSLLDIRFLTLADNLPWTVGPLQLKA